jgi:hypothetical protein
MFINFVINLKQGEKIFPLQEIKNFSKIENGLPVWKKESIDERHQKIVNFGVETWNFDK